MDAGPDPSLRQTVAVSTRHLHDHDRCVPLPAELWARLAGSFGTAADGYQRFRPDYPAEAIADALRSADGRLPVPVLDLGAGTGKLTAVLAAIGITDITAVEPDTAMLARIAEVVPDACCLAGSAERIPLADAAMEAITVGQALHWFDLDLAVPEMARVLRPGGRMVAVWNVRDLAHPFTRAFEACMDDHVRPPGGTSGRDEEQPSPPFTGREEFEEPVLTITDWTRPMTPAGLHGLLDTMSYVITADQAHRSALHRCVDELIDGWEKPLELAERCQVWVAIRR